LALIFRAIFLFLDKKIGYSSKTIIVGFW